MRNLGKRMTDEGRGDGGTEDGRQMADNEAGSRELGVGWVERGPG